MPSGWKYNSWETTHKSLQSSPFINIVHSWAISIQSANDHARLTRVSDTESMRLPTRPYSVHSHWSSEREYFFDAMLTTLDPINVYTNIYVMNVQRKSFTLFFATIYRLWFDALLSPTHIHFRANSFSVTRADGKRAVNCKLGCFSKSGVRVFEHEVNGRVRSNLLYTHSMTLSYERNVIKRGFWCILKLQNKKKCYSIMRLIQIN